MTKDYRDTLNLPKTSFPMKANLPEKESQILVKWENQDLYSKIRKKYKGCKKYILHDGPPYANGDIHIGHALNKILKDIIVKFKTMKGFDASFLPGWDCHGLPVEHQLFMELGISKYEIDKLSFRKKAYRYATKFVNIQKSQFKRLGVFGNWENPYLTIDFGYEFNVVNSLSKLVKKGYIYRGLKPVNWCYVCETALAEAEVEYQEHVSDSIYVKFRLFNIARRFKDLVKNKPYFAVVWTTTPWTLLGNVAVAVQPDFEYCFFEVNNEILIMEKNLGKDFLHRIGIKDYKIIKTVKGAEFEFLEYVHPWIQRRSKLVLADYVTRTDGTGLVHTAPGHGQEDYLTGLKYNLDIIMPVDGKGRFDNSVGEFSGQFVFDANKKIIENLKDMKLLLDHTEISHSYPHCWRCKNPVIFRATSQWFMKIDHENLRNRLLECINNDVTWIPASGKIRISEMVSNRPDWCLSRQRYWGVPIPSIVCLRCRKEFLNSDVIDNYASQVQKEGSDIWFKKDIKTFLPSNYVCPACKSKEFTKGENIIDVWFESGVSCQAVLKANKDLGFPAELYLEGSDQHRGWFQSSLIPAIAIDNKSPFRSVLTHGFVVDGEGRKMSKSLGNVISPHDIIKDYGADILRIWVASSDYSDDVRISKEIISRIIEMYRKIRNTFRFILSNLYDFSPDKDKVKYDALQDIDKWMLYRLELSLELINKGFQNFNFQVTFKTIYNFCNEELSSFYLDILKDRLYTFTADSAKRRSAQTVLYLILDRIVRVTAPFLSFTTEEAWQLMPKESKDTKIISIHLLDWPGKNLQWLGESIQDEGQFINERLKILMQIRSLVLKELENARASSLIGSSLDAKVILQTDNKKLFQYLESFKDTARELFIVSQIEIENIQDLKNKIIIDTFGNLNIIIKKADGEKCRRCWNFHLEVGRDKEYIDLCPRCLKAIGAR